MGLFALLLALIGCSPADAGEQSGTAYQFTFTLISGQRIPLSSFQGKVILVVNTASH
jgi:hypothetical protein